MTEAEWLAATDPAQMMSLIWNGVSDRKLRLFAVACCRVMIAGVNEPSAARAVEASEQFADGSISEEELSAARRATTDDWNCVHEAGEVNSTFTRNAALGAAYQVSRPSARKVVQEIGMLLRRQVGGVPKEFQIEVLRDTLGNPFRPILADPSWLTSDVRNLAEGIYADRAFDRMPILADALQDAGCDVEDVLNHCRSHDVHVRGCWVVDLVLGKG
jgi:hypothetical protein